MEEETWRVAIAAVAYELARRNGNSPMDRGAALGRRVEALAAQHGLAAAFEFFEGEQGYQREESGAECAARVDALVNGVLPRTLIAA
jgi:hypothetical protein